MTRAIDSLKTFHPKSRAAWRAWLEKNHAKSPGIWFIYYKKSSGKLRVTYDEAVEEALCFGWIDSLPRKLDEERSMLLFTPRKTNSVWSQLNKKRVKKLLSQGLIKEAGMNKIKAAQRDGSWAKLDAVDSLRMPADLQKVLAADAAAKKNFSSLSNSVKKNILWSIESAKRPETRAKRIREAVGLAARGKPIRGQTN